MFSMDFCSLGSGHQLFRLSFHCCFMPVDLLPSDTETNAFSNSIFSRLAAFVASLSKNTQIDLHSNSGVWCMKSCRGTGKQTNGRDDNTTLRNIVVMNATQYIQSIISQVNIHEQIFRHLTPLTESLANSLLSSN